MAKTELHPHPEVGAALRWLRNRAGLQQQEVTATSAVWLSQIENGRRQPSWQLVHRLLEELAAGGVDELDQLLTERPWATEGLVVEEGDEWGAAPPPRGSARGEVALAQSLSELNRLFLTMTASERQTLLKQAKRLSARA